MLTHCNSYLECKHPEQDQTFQKELEDPLVFKS
jgi:hypothetical protein